MKTLEQLEKEGFKKMPRLTNIIGKENRGIITLYKKQPDGNYEIVYNGRSRYLSELLNCEERN